MHKWLVIAKNEYRLKTSAFRRIRPFFPFIVILLLAIIIGFIAPAIINLIAEEFRDFFLSPVAAVTIGMILFIIFLLFIFVPISRTLQETQIAPQEILLSAPVRPNDLLLGKFLGDMSIYSIFVAAVAGFFAAALGPLGIDLLQTTIIVAIFVLILFSALWIGVVISAIVRARLNVTAKGRDIGKALAMLMALPLIAVMYALMGGGLLEALYDPDTNALVSAILGFLPSTWGADIIVAFASHPGDIGAIWSDTLLRFGGMVAFFVAVLWLGGKLANRAYSLEPTTISASVAKPEGAFYRSIRRVGGGGSFATLLVSIFKDYGRRLENLSKIAYVIGLVVLINIFLIGTEDADPELPLIMIIFVFPFLTAFIVGEVTIRGKANLFIYRKAPFGERRLVRARLVQGWLLSIPIAAIVTSLMIMIVPGATLLLLFASVGLIVLIVAAYVTFALGLFLLMPVFTEKPAELIANAMILQFTALGIFIFSIIAFSGIFLEMIVVVSLNWVVALLFLFLGARKLRRIE